MLSQIFVIYPIPNLFVNTSKFLLVILSIIIFFFKAYFPYDVETNGILNSKNHNYF